MVSCIARVKSTLFIIAPRFLVGFLLNIRNRFLGYPPPGTDLVGYDILLDWIRKRQIDKLDGDVVEIGSFLGGGTVKLARFFGRHSKKVYAVDIFDPSFDHTINVDGDSMSSLYSNVLGGRTQEEVFRKVIRKYTNIVVIKEDSREVMLPCGKICFSFIDGCHDPDYVRNDFYLVWDKTVAGGVVGFHDYGGDLPQTTIAIDELIEANQDSIKQVFQIREKWIILLTKE